MECIGRLKTRDGTLALRLDLIDGALEKVAHEILQNFVSEGFASRLSFASDPRQRAPHEKKQDGQIVASAWAFVVALLGNVLVTSATCRLPPEVFVGGCPTGDKRVAWLKRMAASWHVLQALEETASDDPQCRSFLKAMAWCEQQFPREVFASLYEAEFSTVPPDLDATLQGFGRSGFSTLLVENLFNAARAQARTNTPGQAEPLALWHVGAFGSSQVLPSFGRPSIGITPVARAASSSSTPQLGDIFKPAGHTFSLGDEVLQNLGKPATWTAAENLQAAALQWELALRMKGNYKKMSKAFFSLLCVPGSLVVHKESKQSRVVLQSSVYGFWAARMPIESGSLQLRLLPCPQDAFTFEVVTKPEVWSAAEIEVLEPHTMPKQGGKLAMRFGKKSASLLKFSVTRLARRVCPSFVHIRAVGTLWLAETPFRCADWFVCHAVAIGKHLAVAFMIPPCSGPLGCPGMGFLCAAKAQESETRWEWSRKRLAGVSLFACRTTALRSHWGGVADGRRVPWHLLVSVRRLQNYRVALMCAH